MSKVFAFPTTVTGEENVFQLTTTGIISVLILILVIIALAVIVQPKE